MSGQSWERRRAQRVNANLNLEVRVPGADPRRTTLQTINISSSGVYFRSDHFIPPMTRLAMEIEVAVTNDAAAGPGTATVPCEGLIVRVTPEVETPGCVDYEVAVFFTSITPEGMANLERHIALLITEDD